MRLMENLQRLATYPAEFRQQLTIDCGGVQRPLREVIEGWQSKDFATLDSGLRAVIGQPVRDPFLRNWWERPRGHSKTSDIALSVSWLLFASRRPLKIAAAAADSDQSGLLRDAIQRLLSLNPWLGEILEVQRGRVFNKHTGSTCEVLASDAPTAYGMLLDAIICDELTHWRNRDLWDAMLSTSGKREKCLMLCITNAGWMDSWQWNLREAIRTDKRWHFSRLDGPVASWISADTLAEQERLLPRAAYERLWLNRWSSGAGDAIADDDLAAAVRDHLMQGPVDAESYVAGLDLGLSRDASALTVVGKDESGHLAVRGTFRWQAKNGAQVNLQDIEDTLVRLHERFRFRSIACDPWQASHIVQRCRVHGLPIMERPQSGNRLVEQAAALLEAVRDRRLAIDAGSHELIADLRRARIVEKSYGFRIESPRDSATGHGDALSALSIALAVAKEIRHNSSWRYDPVGSLAQNAMKRISALFDRGRRACPVVRREPGNWG
jgi:phage terminase large subunit-like protein